MTKLYYSPRACSLAPHIVLEELGIPYELKQVNFSAGEQLTPEYLKINPRARVPALETEGEVLTEVGAILTYLADRHPEHGLVPEPGTLLRGRCHEWLSFLGSSVHIGYAQLWRPERFTDDAAAKKTVTAAGREALRARVQLNARDGVARHLAAQHGGRLQQRHPRSADREIPRDHQPGDATARNDDPHGAAALFDSHLVLLSAPT